MYMLRSLQSEKELFIVGSLQMSTGALHTQWSAQWYRGSIYSVVYTVVQWLYILGSLHSGTGAQHIQQSTECYRDATYSVVHRLVKRFYIHGSLQSGAGAPHNLKSTKQVQMSTYSVDYSGGLHIRSSLQNGSERHLGTTYSEIYCFATTRMDPRN